MVPPTSDRVESVTSYDNNARIYQETVYRLSKIIENPPEKRSSLIANRLKELNNEWDIERLLEFNASSLLIITGILSYIHSIKWLFLTIAIASFLLQHAIQGWCPPVPIFRSYFKIRTSVEILTEKVALKFFRGDYQSINKKFIDQQFNDNIYINVKQLLDTVDLHSYNDKQYQQEQF
ncbi:unnamed protein product [Rotaria sp. Silwood1]|nr:unnamed protein product [Rotaria sp. Silwood1]CAF1124342.1 unnamed protein product [Rotaria sp. Silwood1]CAF1306236.1 unnamed protein product [Rotaria sp. Silwood1]CAF3504453.1 unnamed protein product [Rotaria sp. Silwood1]CAF3545948.1 unnamed protein product [Rotaria sp. Silwood1]